ncbi:MAG TPA: HAMP domain-containing histidine kinase [Euryarchaeota archaeon]|nr:HAMP domain-containing histidine kinase [Euryarchaeota archaeon]
MNTGSTAIAEGSRPNRSSREELMDRVINLTLNFLFNENPEEIIEQLGKTVTDMFPVRSLIIYSLSERDRVYFPRTVIGYPEDRIEEIKKKMVYDQSDLDRYARIGVRLGRFAFFYPAEEIGKGFEKEKYSVLDLDKIDSVRKEKDDWHPLDRLDFHLYDRSHKEIGYIGITSTKTGKMLDDESLEGLELLAFTASVAFELANLREKERRMANEQEMRAIQMSKILQVTNSLLTLSDPTTLLDRILELIEELFDFQAGAIALYDESEGYFKWKAIRGYTADQTARAMEIRVPIGIVEEDTRPEYRIGFLAHFRPMEKMLPSDLEYFFIPESEMDEAMKLLDMPRKSDDSWHPFDDLNFTIFDGTGKTIGILSVDKPADDKIPDREAIEIIEIFVSLVAIALENSNLYSKTLQSRDEIHVLNRLMFHDLMNYNMAIRGYVELAISSNEANLQKYVRKGLEQIERTAELINKIKKLSMIRSTDRSNLIRIDLGRTVRMQASKSAALFPSKKVKFDFNLCEEDAFVMANDLLPDLFHNIIINAIKFNMHDTVKIEIEMMPVEKIVNALPRKYWKISISDHGPGIPDERKDMIFIESSRLEDSTRGMGLGLSIVKSLVDLYDGDVWVEDRENGAYEKGAKFSVQLPAS